MKYKTIYSTKPNSNLLRKAIGVYRTSIIINGFYYYEGEYLKTDTKLFKKL